MKTPTKNSFKKIGVSVVRNCADIISFSVLNNYVNGADEVLILDNGSADGTFEKLKYISEHVPGIHVLQDESDFDQPRMFECLINGYLEREGKALIVPFDCDEFWQIDLEKVAENFTIQEFNSALCPVINYVQRYAVDRVKKWNDFCTTWAALPRKHVDYEAVIAGYRSGIQVRPKRKVIFLADTPVTLGKGQHRVDFHGKIERRVDGFKCLHLPLRSRAELSRRIDDYAPRTIANKTDKTQSWHMTALVDGRREFGEEALWRANSVRRGFLNINGNVWPCVPDFRLLNQIKKIKRYAEKHGLDLEKMV